MCRLADEWLYELGIVILEGLFYVPVIVFSYEQCILIIAVVLVYKYSSTGLMNINYTQHSSPSFHILSSTGNDLCTYKRLCTTCSRLYLNWDIFAFSTGS